MITTHIKAQKIAESKVANQMPSQGDLDTAEQTKESPPAVTETECPEQRGSRREAIGWLLDVTGRTIAVIGLGAFVAPALLQLAREAAGCETEAPPGENKIPDCDERTHGFKPSSLFTIMLTVVGVGSAPLLPLMGAMVDYTEHRRSLGRVVSVVFCALLFPLVFVNNSNWFAMAIVFIAAFFVFTFQMVLAYSYLPELTDSEDVMNAYTRNFTMVSFAFVVLFVVIVVAASGAAGLAEDEVATAKISQSISFSICLGGLSAAWWCFFQQRPSARQLSPSQSLWTAGFEELYNTMLKIKRGYRALRLFFLSIAFCDAAFHALTTIMITFLSDKLEFNGMEIGVAATIMLLCSIPGGWAAGRVTKWSEPITSSKFSLFVVIINTATAAAVLTGPERKNYAYFFTGIWGFASAWKFTSDRMLVSLIIPGGQNVEMMGFYLFSGLVLSWVPPLVFTALNEVGVSQRIGLATLDVYYLAGLLCYFLMGSFRAAVENARPSPSEIGSEEQPVAI